MYCARKNHTFCKRTQFGNPLPVAGKVKPHDFYNGVP